MKKKTDKEKIEYQRHQFIRRWFLVARCQAKMRGQVWNLTWDDFYRLWSEDDRWMNRGRAKENYCMCRTDMDGDWEISNIEMTTRSEMLKRESVHNRRKI
mgnify:CR=1 FL=1|tara:strand:- start:4124 stop:4423 length:300 start_codon:yes stop_codon:yes gene_type:complete